MSVMALKGYTFGQLNHQAKDAAREWWREGQFDHDWWDGIYEDAAAIGLNITSFDLDRNKHAEGELTESAVTVVERILENHGDGCETHKLAVKYSAARLAWLLASDEANCDDWQEVVEANDEFLRRLLECYADILQAEYDYQQSDEYVDGAIRCNDYQFNYKGEIL